MISYNPEKYWDAVAANIRERQKDSFIAGDDDPYYKYKRRKFLKLLQSISFYNKKVVEIGSGPGGNLAFISRAKPAELWGVDISQHMLDIAAAVLKEKDVKLKKTNGRKLDFPSAYFDIAFTSTVLQHNTNEAGLAELIGEICRISNNEIYLFERTEKKIKGHESNLGRPVSYYRAIMKENGFELKEVKYLHIRVSYGVCGLIRKLFNSKNRKEGERISRVSFILETIALPVTKLLDAVIPQKRDLTMMKFSMHPRI